MSNGYDLSELVERAKKEAQEEAEIKAIVGDATEVERAAQLPKPSGYRILCAIPDVEEQYESGLIKADATKSSRLGRVTCANSPPFRI